MTERRTIARPYAAAVFQVAREHDRLDSWSGALRFMAAVARDTRMRATLCDRTLIKAKIAEMFIAICGDRIDETNRNFIRVAAENGRLSLLPEIAEMYEALRAEYEHRVDAVVTSAYPLSATYRDRIAAAVRARMGEGIELEWDTNPDLLGGIVVRTKDLVIDASVDGWLAELANTLNR